MKVIVNVSSVSPPITGIGNYSLNLVSALLNKPEIEDIRGFDVSGWFSREQLARRLDTFSVEHVAPKSTGLLAKYKLNAKAFARNIPGARSMKRRLVEHRFAQCSEGLAGYIYWEPNYLLFPFSGRRITTIHDLSHIYYPQFHPKDRVKALSRHLKSSIERSDHLIAVSEFSKRQIQEAFAVDDTAISVVHPAVAETYRCEKSPEQIAAVRQRYGLPAQFVLSVGTMEPRKNLSGLIRAFERLPETLQSAYPLVFVGAKGWLSEDIEKRVEALVAKRRALKLGYVCAQDMPSLYAAATLFAYPSFYEGFGMPIAEAMAAGTAVLTSNVSAMPEVAGQAAELVAPEDIDSIQSGLQNVLEDADHRASLAEKGRVHSQQFCWSASCDRLLEVFAHVG